MPSYPFFVYLQYLNIQVFHLESGMFFFDIGENFFRPLASKYRFIYADAIRNLYLNTHGPMADYSVHLNKDDIIRTVEKSYLTNIKFVIASEGEDEFLECNTDIALINSLFRSLVDDGWLESFMDSHTMKKAYRMTYFATKIASLFCTDIAVIKVNTQNTSSVRSNLENFVRNIKQNENFDINDLMTATTMSNQIVVDLNDLIQDVVECRRMVIKQMTSDSVSNRESMETFLNFVGSKFKNEISPQFTKDSVKKYYVDIRKVITEIHEFNTERKAKIETAIRKYYPNVLEHIERIGQRSALLWALDTIERQVSNAINIKMPELSLELTTLTHRATSALQNIINLTHANEANNNIYYLFKQLRRLPVEEQKAVIEKSGQALIQVGAKYHNHLDVKPTKLAKRTPIKSKVRSKNRKTPEQILKERIRERLAELCNIELTDIKSHVLNTLVDGGSVRLSTLPVTNWRELIQTIQVERLGSASLEQIDFHIEKIKGEFIDTLYFSGEDLRIRLLHGLV